MRLSRSTKIIIAIAVVICGCVVWIWHVRHEDVRRLAHYTIRFPSNWLVTAQTPDALVIARSDRPPAERSGVASHTPLTIVLLQEQPLRDVSAWTSFTTRSFKERGTETVHQKSIELDGEAFQCIGGNGLSPKDLKSVPLGLSWDCRSSGPLEIMVSGNEADQKEAWDIVARIRKR